MQKVPKLVQCSATLERDGSHISFSQIHTGAIWSSEKTRPDRSCIPSGLRNGSFQQVPKTVPSSATAERAGTPVSFLLIRNAGVWPSQQTGTDQACSPLPTAAGSEPQEACQRIYERQRFRKSRHSASDKACIRQPTTPSPSHQQASRQGA